MKEENSYEIAFQRHYELYEFRVMPFGLTDAPTTFQSLMNNIFEAYLRVFLLVFFDNILVYSSSMEQHKQHLEMVFTLLRQH